MGNFDKMTLEKTHEDVEAEFQRLLPLMKEGGFIMMPDHLITPGVALEDYKWYLEIRKWGACVHSGFGLGLERLIMWICKLDHIRDAIPFPRTVTRVFP